MRIASFTVDSRASYGLVTPDGIVDLAQRTGIPTLRALLDAGGLARAEAHASARPDFGTTAI